MPKTPSDKKKGKTGRPKKFGRPSKSYYLILPEDIVGRLRAIDPDMATAIVKVVEGIRIAEVPNGVEVDPLAPGQVLLWVGEIPPLHNWKGVFLHKVEPGRYLMVLDQDYDLARFELDLRDWLEVGHSDGEEAKAMQYLAGILRQLRLEGQVPRGVTVVGLS